MRYFKPGTAAEAATALAGEAGVTRVLAGGTDVLVQLKAGMVEPDLIVDIKAIDGMRSITAEAGGFRIGAAVSGAELGAHGASKAMWPRGGGVRLIGSTQVQGRATMRATSATAPGADSVPVCAGRVARMCGLRTRDCRWNSADGAAADCADQG